MSLKLDAEGALCHATVLVVDDEPAIREMLTDALARKPYEVLCAGSAEEALTVLAAEPVDVTSLTKSCPAWPDRNFGHCPATVPFAGSSGKTASASRKSKGMPGRRDHRR